MTSSDPFDPNTWVLDEEYEHRIYGDNNAQTWAAVDEEDYHWAIQWCWHINKPHPARNGQKRYLVRSTSNGRRPGPKLFLHIEILKRSKKRKPTSAHKWVDHKDGNEHNCQRLNLRWVTPKQNRRKHGMLVRLTHTNAESH